MCAGGETDTVRVRGIDDNQSTEIQFGTMPICRLNNGHRSLLYTFVWHDDMQDICVDIFIIVELH